MTGNCSLEELNKVKIKEEPGHKPRVWEGWKGFYMGSGASWVIGELACQYIGNSREYEMERKIKEREK